MQDRVPTYPGRVLLEPVSGEPNKYDLSMADEPTAAGSAYNKANVLPDDLCAMLGLPTTAEPKDAFLRLRKMSAGSTSTFQRLFSGRGFI